MTSTASVARQARANRYLGHCGGRGGWWRGGTGGVGVDARLDSFIVGLGVELSHALEGTTPSLRGPGGDFGAGAGSGKLLSNRRASSRRCAATVVWVSAEGTDERLATARGPDGAVA